MVKPFVRTALIALAFANKDASEISRRIQKQLGRTLLAYFFLYYGVCLEEGASAMVDCMTRGVEIPVVHFDFPSAQIHK